MIRTTEKLLNELPFVPLPQLSCRRPLTISDFCGIFHRPHLAHEAT